MDHVWINFLQKLTIYGSIHEFLITLSYEYLKYLK
ncbi:hypothetical protein SAMN05421821_103315 [Mucilaginibacter lappiensis]|nr:hypothetical protein SAMN05421821_103315 [Mucilaginibacter lappiensis]